MTKKATSKRTKVATLIAIVMAMLVSLTSCGESESKNRNVSVYISLADEMFTDSTYNTEQGASENAVKVVLLEDNTDNSKISLRNNEGVLDSVKYKEYLDTLSPNQKVTVNMTGWDEPVTYCGRIPAVGTIRSVGRYGIVVTTTDDPEEVGIFPTTSSENPIEAAEVDTDK